MTDAKSGSLQIILAPASSGGQLKVPRIPCFGHCCFSSFRLPGRAQHFLLPPRLSCVSPPSIRLVAQIASSPKEVTQEKKMRAMRLLYVAVREMAALLDRPSTLHCSTTRRRPLSRRMGLGRPTRRLWVAEQKSFECRSRGGARIR